MFLKLFGRVGSPTEEVTDPHAREPGEQLPASQILRRQLLLEDTVSTSAIVRSAEFAYAGLQTVNALFPLTLQKLCLRGNALTSFDFGMPHLNYLDLSFNFLTAINLIALPSIKVLNCSFNRFNVLPISISLCALDCSCNALDSLPEHLSMLEHLDVRKNQIPSIAIIQNAENLKTLKVCGNSITELRVSAILPSLTVLHASHNPTHTVDLDPLLLPSLEELLFYSQDSDLAIRLALHFPNLKKVNDLEIDDTVRQALALEHQTEDQIRAKVDNVFDRVRLSAQENLKGQIRYLDKLKAELHARELEGSIDIAAEKGRIRRLLLSKYEEGIRVKENSRVAEDGLPDIVRLSRIRVSRN